MKTILCLVLSILAGLASGQATNTYTITDLSGSTQTLRPFTLSRTFVEGEIASYPQPLIGGVAPSAWQVDVKTRYTGGSVRHAYISFRTTLSASGSITVGFQNNANPCHLGNLATCQAAALDQTGMLNFDAGAGAGNWRARIQTIASGITQSKEARGLMAAGYWSYWLRGPVVTRVIVENRTTALADDWGYQCTANCTTNYASATWVTAPSALYQSLHAQYEVAFYTGYAGVEVDYILENPWSTKLQDQRYDLTLYKNFPETSAFTQSGLTHWARARWHKKFWNGTTPGKVKIDHNFQYLIDSKLLPNFDTTKVVPANTITSVVNRWDNNTDQGALFGNYSCNGGLNCTGFWQKYMPGTGGREEIGLFPTWLVRWFYTFHTVASGTDLTHIAYTNTDIIGQAPMHVREANTSTSLKFCALSELCVSQGLSTVNAFGYQRTRDAYPSNLSTTPLVTLSGSHNWNLDTAHQASMAYAQYALDGSWYYLQEMNYWAGWDIERSPVGTNRWYMGHNDWGYLRDQIRGMAWSLRNVGHAAVMNPDGTPEKAYFTQKILNNISVHEGKANITTGYGYTNDNTKWSWGNTQGSGISDVNQLTHVPNLLFFTSWETPSMENINTTITRSIQPQWQANFFLITIGHLEELGLPFTALRTNLGKNLLNQLQNPSYNPWLVAEYRTPAIIKAGGDHYATTWAEVKSGYITSEQSISTWPAGGAQNNADSGYPWYARAAASYLPGLSDGALTGNAAWAWFAGKLNETLLNSNPKWAIIPRSTPLPTPPVISSPSSASGLTGTAFTYQITASNSPTSYNATGLPSGLSINTGTGLISGSPAVAAVSTITLSATNAQGTGQLVLTLTITNPLPNAPVVSSAGTASGQVGVSFSYSIVASDSPTSYSASSLPSGLSVNTGTGAITGTPTVAGSYNALIGATNAGGTGTKPLVITIDPAISPCDLDSSGAVDSTDIALSAVYTLAGSATGDLDGDNQSTVVDTQRIVNASLGSACRTGP